MFARNWEGFNKMRERPSKPFDREAWLKKQRTKTAEQRTRTPLGDIKRVAPEAYREKWRENYQASSGDPLKIFQGRGMLKIGDFANMADRRCTRVYNITVKNVKMLHDRIISWLRHEEDGVTNQKERPLKFDKLGRVRLDALTRRFSTISSEASLAKAWSSTKGHGCWCTSWPGTHLVTSSGVTRLTGNKSACKPRCPRCFLQLWAILGDWTVPKYANAY